MKEEVWKKSILPIDRQAQEFAKARWLKLAKPLKGLGLLEEDVVKLTGILGKFPDISRRCVVVMCADNGVVEEGVTQTGKDVTKKVADGIFRHITTVTKLAEIARCDCISVDVGVDGDCAYAWNKKVAYGTKNIVREPGMTRKQAEKAVQAGIDTVKELKEKGYRLIAAGEMGIGNTTTASASACALLHRPADEMTGKGAGLSSDGLRKKIDVVRRAVDLHRPNAYDSLDVISKVGGFDIAGMTGLCLGGAIYGIPIVIDGFISAVSALLAKRIDERVMQFLFASHLSKEPAARLVMEELGLKPKLYCEMALGEGTGAVMSLPLLDMALNAYKTLPFFGDMQIEDYKPL